METIVLDLNPEELENSIADTLNAMIGNYIPNYLKAS